MIRVVIVDDHELLTESLVRLINDDPEVQVVATESTALAGIDRITEERPDIVIMDYSLPDMDGASATKLLRQRVQDIAVIMLTGSERPGAYSAAMEAGCAAWVRKTHAAHELLEAIHRV
ncbi:MAG TPA: response regulator transcription factor, partial [Acidimicrobiales bacterium]|nr:response regulator transcription factor [Acidimicrobiales bacterium]